MCVDVISVYSLMSFRCIPVQHGTHTKSVYSLIKIYLSIYLIGVLLLWRGWRRANMAVFSTHRPPASRFWRTTRPKYQSPRSSCFPISRNVDKQRYRCILRMHPLLYMMENEESDGSPLMWMSPLISSPSRRAPLVHLVIRNPPWRPSPGRSSASV